MSKLHSGHEFEYITLARIFIAQYERERVEHAIHDAMGLLERLLNAANMGGRMGRVIVILLLQARAHGTLGDTSAALVSLQRALVLAEPEGYVQAFVDAGRPMALLLSEAFTRGIMVGYTGKLLAAFGAENPESAINASFPHSLSAQLPSPTSPLADPLSPRELELLQLVAQGLSNREISERLFLALDSVKGHNRRIYAKLQAQSRTEAVARARALGLL